MKTYRLDKSKLPQEKKKLWMVYGISFLVMVVLSFALNWGKETVKSLTWMLPLMLAMFTYFGIQAYKQRKDLWSTYKLDIFDDHLVQTQPKFPDLKLNWQDLTSIEEKKFGLLVSSKQGRNILVVPRLMAEGDYAEVKTVLEGWLRGEPAVATEAEQLDSVAEAQEGGVEQAQEVPMDEISLPEVAPDESAEPGSESSDSL